MPNVHDDGMQPSRVTAVFGHSALTFTLSKGATLADIADRLDHPGRRHRGMPVAIDITFSALHADAAPSRDPRPWRAAKGWPIRP